MKALVRIYSMDSATSTTEARLEFYQIGMLLDELGSDCPNQTAQLARVEIFEQGLKSLLVIVQINLSRYYLWITGTRTYIRTGKA